MSQILAGARSDFLAPSPALPNFPMSDEIPRRRAWTAGISPAET